MDAVTAPTIDAQGILDARNELGMSQAKFAEALGVRTNTVFRWETGRSRISTPGLVARAVRDLEHEVRATMEAELVPAGAD